MHGMPIVTLTVDGMRHTVQHALMQYQDQLSSEVDKAVREVCTPECVQAVVHRSVVNAAKAVLECSIEDFFRRGDGNKLIQDLVIAVFSPAATGAGRDSECDRG